MSTACGGTTGAYDEPPAVEVDGGNEATPVVDASIGADASADLDTGSFDVEISYLDRPLPDVQAMGDSSAAVDSGSEWPSCAPFIPVSANGVPAPLGSEFTQIPGVYTDGGIAAAPDGSVCASYPWLGATAIDECVAENSNGFVELPPCNWVADAGVAAEGPAAGQPRYALCRALFDCIMRTGCGVTDVGSCLCGMDTNSLDCQKNPAGPCMQEEMSALELPLGSISDALKNYEHASTDFTGFGGAFLNTVFQNGENPYQQTMSCFSPTDAEAGDGGVPDATVQDTGTPDSKPVATGVLDAGPKDSGSPNASVPDGAPLDTRSDAADDSGRQVPCTTAAQTSCARCSGNSDGLCTATEAAFVQHDLDAGRDPNYGDPNGIAGNSSCYACLFASSCINDTAFGDVGHECGDLSGTFGSSGPSQALCGNVLNCVLATSCAGPPGVAGEASASSADISICYCGGHNAGNACQNANPADGPCHDDEVTGLGVSDNATVLKDFTDLTRPAGMANQIFSCAESNGCTACLQ